MHITVSLPNIEIIMLIFKNTNQIQKTLVSSVYVCETMVTIHAMLNGVLILVCFVKLKLK